MYKRQTQKRAEFRYPDVASLVLDLKRSLVDPEGDFVRIRRVPGSDTVMLSEGELQQLQMNNISARRYDDYDDDDYDEEQYDDYDNDYDDDYDDDYDLSLIHIYVIAEGKQAIVLIPEIALTYQTVMRFYQRFGDRVSIINSRLSKGERYRCV